jgi:hypothetical protein
MPPFFISAAAAIKENAMAQLEAAAEIQGQHPAGGAQFVTDISHEVRMANRYALGDGSVCSLSHIFLPSLMHSKKTRTMPASSKCTCALWRLNNESTSFAMK